MLGTQLVVVSDAHLGAAPKPTEEALLAFLDAAPTLGDCLLVNGDLFHFWFAYRQVVPRSGFLAAAALAHLRRRMPIVMTGGNHDRWGDSFWDRDMGIIFSAGEVRFEAAGRRVVALHGDGVAETHWGGALLHRITKHPFTARVFGFLHPTVGFALVGAMSPRLADPGRQDSVLVEAAARQAEWAGEQIRQDPTIDLLVLGHTHRPATGEPEPGRHYLNPGAWIDGQRYAVVTETDIGLRQWP
ncbi:MAG: metallophosphoesterase [Gemmatimonadota bacterium]